MWIFVLAVAVLISWSVWLSLIDVRVHRLPDPFTLPVAASAVTTAALLETQVLLAGLTWPALYLLVGVCMGGIGGGDIKLAVSLGILAASVAGLPAVLASCLLSGVGAIALGVTRRRQLSAHGPPMFAATAVVCVLSSWATN